MGFWGTSFTYDNTPCEIHDLMIYNIGNSNQGDASFASIPKVNEEVVGSKWKPFFYGVQFEKKLEFEIVFGVNQDRIDAGRYLSRYEIEEIASWLTGHDEYKWLQVNQDDLMHVRYKCIVSSLQIVSYGEIPWAMKAKFSCNSPYAYLLPEEISFQVNGSTEIELYNRSSHNGFYMPIIEFTPASYGSEFSVLNQTDSNRGLKFSKVPSSTSSIVVNNETGVIESDANENLYQHFNFEFLRLKRGRNVLKITGNGTVVIRCEFPVNVGG